VLTVLVAVLATIVSAVAAKMFGALLASACVGASSLAAGVLDSQTVVPIAIAVLSSGFVFGLFKIMPERRSILIQASENAVKVVNDAIGTLERELKFARAEISRLERELATAEHERAGLAKEIVVVRDRVRSLEKQLNGYTQAERKRRTSGSPPRD
jgi:septal ring factor EnvC (AmiA/AmiB activator)